MTLREKIRHQMGTKLYRQFLFGQKKKSGSGSRSNDNVSSPSLYHLLLYHCLSFLARTYSQAKILPKRSKNHRFKRPGRPLKVVPKGVGIGGLEVVMIRIKVFVFFPLDILCLPWQPGRQSSAGHKLYQFPDYIFLRRKIDPTAAESLPATPGKI